MNLEQLRKNIGWRIQLAPTAIHLDAFGRELPSRNEDWIIKSVDAKVVQIAEATGLGLTTALGSDIVHRFDTNQSRSTSGGLQYGFLVLAQQMFIQHSNITFVPSPRPGERVPPRRVVIEELWVDVGYPNAVGITAKLEEAGYRIRWVRVSRMPRLELEGWEVVVELDRRGLPITFHVGTNPENLVLAKTSHPDLAQLANSPVWQTNAGLISCRASPDASELVFSFEGPTEAIAFLLKMGRDPSVIRCAMAPGRVDTVLGRLTEHGTRMMRAKPPS